MLSQSPVCSARRKRIFLKAPWLFTITQSLASFAASQFFSSRLSPLMARIWSVVENPAHPCLNQSSCSFHVENCCISLLLMSWDSVVPVLISLPVLYLELLQLEGRFSVFQRKYKTKRFPAERFPDLQTPILYPLSHVAKRSTPIGPHKLPRRNSPKDISPPFFWEN